ncbi:MAG TPA: hypothetical protein VNP04_32445 [Alphaproteobacteria bacterium]|nr:hypothetical protein [Alphaproteobacteria bacterium]
MPWEAILGGASGGIAVAMVVAVLFLKSLTEKLVDAAQKRFESALKRAEDLHKSALAMATTVDTDLRARRITAYSELWKKTCALPQWPRNRELTYQDLRSLTDDFRKWYFETGGMYLSTKAREAYGEVQESLASVLEKARDGRVIDSDYDAIRGKCSMLRAELTRDLLSRREAPEI